MSEPTVGDFVGANLAKAGYLTWNRRRDETEAQFLARCRAEAGAAGHSYVYFTGYVSVIPPASSEPLQTEPRDAGQASGGYATQATVQRNTHREGQITARVLQFAAPKRTEPAPYWDPELGAYVRDAIYFPRDGETLDACFARALADAAAAGIYFNHIIWPSQLER